MTLHRDAAPLRALFLALVLATTSSAQATETIAFGGPDGQIDIGEPTIEGSFVYEPISGALYRGGSRGNAAPDLEGRFTTGGGVARIARADVPGGFFTFDAVDVGQSGIGITLIDAEGYLGGVLVGSQSFTTSGVTNDFTTFAATNFDSLLLDELRFNLDADPGWESIDNLVLTTVIPEPMAFGLAMACVAVGLAHRRR
ncbi:MAG: hypothetical protein AAF266_14525 [Planctomycetota bacterium]